jgi:hypothetical protein
MLKERTMTKPKAPAPAKKAPAATKAPGKSPAKIKSNPAQEAVQGPGGKLGVLVSLLGRPQGACIAEMIAATAWQPHSVRGAIAGALKTKWKLKITSEKAEGGRIYRLAQGAR